MTSQNAPRPARQWKLRTRTLQFGPFPVLMGIVNVTPDSFSDGGQFLNPDRAVAHGKQLVEWGADILDVGGESTRPYSEPVSEAEELRRVTSVVQRLAQETTAAVSIDTSKASVARAALEVGAEIINDVTGLRSDPAMFEVARLSQAGVCVMHMRGTPQTMQVDPQYGDVVREIHDYLRGRRDALVSAGIDPARICLDPGIGFGKTHQHNLQLMRHCDRFHSLGCPLLVGHSRKGFLAHILDDRQCDRAAATVGAAFALALRGVQVIRVHDVQPVRQALVVSHACGGLDGSPAGLHPPDDFLG